MENIKPLEELLDSVRDIDGFPIGTDEDILALSNPPYYTACPNPYIKDFIEEHGKPYDEDTDTYNRDPFVGDVSEGKTEPIYLAHTYHTKVPPKAIEHYIKHYTEEEDLVFDGFCGTGMTGVAAQNVNRKPILSDLSPIATFISQNLNNLPEYSKYDNVIKKVLTQVVEECGWMYETKDEKNIKRKINYIIWSDKFVCPFCQSEYIFWEQALDDNKNLLSDFRCQSCGAIISKATSSKLKKTFYDIYLHRNIEKTVQVPVLINYMINNKKYYKFPDNDDLNLINKIENIKIPYFVPISELPFGDKTIEPKKTHNCTHVHQFFTKRNLYFISCFFHYAKKNNLSDSVIFTLTSFLVKTGSILHNIGMKNGNINLAGAMPNAFYIPSLYAERNLEILAMGKIKDIENAIKNCNYCKKDSFSIISTASATKMNIKSDSIDYIFIDPPFGANLMYSELNFLWEAWLKVLTNNKKEAIINNSQNKKLSDYFDIMFDSFKEFYRILKPNRWITIEFHNSKSYVWNSIQEAITKAGFIIAQVALLNKGQGTYNQMVAAGSVEKDLVISAYKPKGEFQRRFLEFAGEGMEEEFIKMHLNHLPTEPSIERTEQMLYSKLLAFYVQRSYAIRYDASAFYKMLRSDFSEEDGYWFLSDQIGSFREYKQKMKLQGISDIASGQSALFVADEKSALIWLNSFLISPKSFQEIHPSFTKVEAISGDLMPELKEILDANFVSEDGKYRRPQTEEEKLSINEKREKALLKEFEELLLEARGSKKKIKEVRKQAVLFGFEYCYKRERFKDILTLANKLNRTILENDSELNEFVEVAQIKVEGM